MKKAVFLSLTAVFALTLTMGAAQAQFVDTKTPEITNVQKVLKDGKDDQWVVLEGKIIERIKDDDYRFRDATGTIEIEIDDDDFRGQRVTPDTLIRIEGEVDTERFRDNTIEVERLTVLK